MFDLGEVFLISDGNQRSTGNCEQARHQQGKPGGELSRHFGMAAHTADILWHR